MTSKRQGNYYLLVDCFTAQEGTFSCCFDNPNSVTTRSIFCLRNPLQLYTDYNSLTSHGGMEG